MASSSVLSLISSVSGSVCIGITSGEAERDLERGSLFKSLDATKVSDEVVDVGGLTSFSGDFEVRL